MTEREAIAKLAELIEHVAGYVALLFNDALADNVLRSAQEAEVIASEFSQPEQDKPS